MAILLGFVYGILFASSRLAAMTSFFSVFAIWFLAAFFIDYVNGFYTSRMISDLMGLAWPFISYLLTALLAAIGAALASFTAFYLKRTLRKHI